MTHQLFPAGAGLALLLLLPIHAGSQEFGVDFGVEVHMGSEVFGAGVDAEVRMQNGDVLRARLLQESLVLRTEYATLHLPTNLLTSLSMLDTLGLVEVVVAGEDRHFGELPSATFPLEIFGGARVEVEGILSIDFDVEPPLMLHRFGLPEGAVLFDFFDLESPPRPEGAVLWTMRNGDSFWAVPMAEEVLIQTAYGAFPFGYADIDSVTLQPNGDVDVMLRDEQGRFSGMLIDEEFMLTMRSGETVSILPRHVLSLGVWASVGLPPESTYQVPSEGLSVALAIMGPGAYRIVVHSDQDPVADLYTTDREGIEGRGSLVLSNDDGGPGDSSQIDFCVIVPTQYELFIRDHGGAASTAVVTLEDIDMSEPLPIGTPVVRDILGLHGAWAMFRIETIGDYVIDVVAQTADFDPWIQLISPSSSLGTDDDGGDGYNSRLSVTLVPGSYCLFIKEFGGDFGQTLITISGT